jgi:hypothetical protein
VGRRLSGEGFVRRVEQLTWSDLTPSSQKKLLKKAVKIQGAKISLNEIMTAEPAVAKCLPLGALLEENELKIADTLQIYNAYNTICYIERDFRRQIAINLTDVKKISEIYWLAVNKDSNNSVKCIQKAMCIGW